MGWNEVSPGHFQQPLGHTEHPFVFFSEVGKEANREHWSLHAVASVAFGDDFQITSRFRNAWRALHLEYPELDATVDIANSLKHSVKLDQAELSKRVEETFFVEESYTDAESLIANLRPTKYPTCHIVRSKPSRATVIIHTSHWRIDGIGAFHLLNRFLTLSSLTDPAKSASPSTGCFSPTYEDIIKYAPPSSATSAQVTQTLLSFFSHLPSAGFRPDNTDSAAPPSGTRSLIYTVTPASTATLVQACKNLRISVTAAVQSALAVLTFRHADDEAKERPLAITTPVDLRRYYAMLQKGDQHAMGIHMSCLYSITRQPEDFFTRARMLMKDYSHARDPVYQRDEVPEIAKQVTQMLLQQPPPPSLVLPSATMCSNFGVVDGTMHSDYDDGSGSGLKLDAVRVGVEVANRENLLHVWTFRGKLNLAFCWNEAFYKRDTMETWMEELLRCLETEMQIELECER